ncbi:MAG: PaaI family thioesterase [Pseudomonadota bacterium]
MSAITIEQFNAIAEGALPFAQLMGLQLETIDENSVTMRAVYNDTFLRPGGTVSGPVMMGLADAAVYALILSHIGPVELAVTTNLNINFLRKPEPGDVIAKASMLKLGKRLAVAQAYLFSASDDTGEPVAHVTSTYSIPPR